MNLILCVFNLIGFLIQPTLGDYDHYYELVYNFFVESVASATHNNLPFLTYQSYSYTHQCPILTPEVIWLIMVCLPLELNKTVA
jgi:hypothetical protein